MNKKLNMLDRCPYAKKSPRERTSSTNINNFDDRRPKLSNKKIQTKFNLGIRDSLDRISDWREKLATITSNASAFDRYIIHMRDKISFEVTLVTVCRTAISYHWNRQYTEETNKPDLRRSMNALHKCGTLFHTAEAQFSVKRKHRFTPMADSGPPVPGSATAIRKCRLSTVWFVSTITWLYQINSESPPTLPSSTPELNSNVNDKCAAVQRVNLDVTPKLTKYSGCTASLLLLHNHIRGQIL